jgi:hypothetical protein
MARVVYAWELGGGFGHIHAFLPLAEDLRRQGHDTVFVLKDLLNAERELGARGFRCLQAPLFQGRLVGLPDPPANLSEILLHFGFLKEEYLLGLVRAWQELYALLGADLVVGDYSPAALLAARVAGIAAASFGTGFCRPPAVHPLPNLRPWEPAESGRLLSSDLKLVDTANRVLRKFGGPAIGKAAEVFACAEDFLCTYPELDHYPERPGARYWGSVHSLDGAEVAWPGREEHRIFGYVKPSYGGLRRLLNQLARLKRHETILFCPGLAEAVAEQYASPRLLIVRKPVALSGLRASCGLGLCHAGHGTVCALLQAGVPVLALPMNLEQHLTGQRVAAMGAGALVEAPGPGTDYLALIGALLNGPEYRRSAQDFMRRYQDRTQERIRGEIGARLLELAG